MLTARDVIETLGLSPHPEGGWYRETWRAAAAPGERPSGTAIHFLLEQDQRSHWHRVDATEIWHWHLGVPVALELAPEDGIREEQRLGPDLAGGERPQRVVPPGCWQSARPLGGFALVGCTVSPGFTFEGFELAPPGWQPGGKGSR